MPPLRGGGYDFQVKTSNNRTVNKIIEWLKKNGMDPIVEKFDDTYTSITMPYNSVPFSKASAICKAMSKIEEDPDIDNNDFSVEYYFEDDTVKYDVKLAKSQAPHIKFTYTSSIKKSDKKTPFTELDQLKNDTDNIQLFFEMVEQNELIQNKDNDKENDEENDEEEMKQPHKNDAIETWWYKQTETLKRTIERQFDESEEEYELVAINLLYNPKHAIQFMAHKDCDKSQVMFHGTGLAAFKDIFEKGFILSTKSIGKFYGNGHYFTSQALHAIRYLKLCKDRQKFENKDKNQFTLIAAFVNPGKIKEVNSLEYKDKPIDISCDSHHVQVTDGINGHGKIGLPIYKDYNGDVMDEYAIRDSTRILPRFYITLKRVKHVFVWRDKNIHNHFNGGVLKELQSCSGAMYGVIDTQSAIQIIQKKQEKNKVFVITNGAHNGEEFVNIVRNKLKLQTEILVFCAAVDWHSKWAQKYHNVKVQCGKKNIIKFVKEKYNDDK